MNLTPYGSRGLFPDIKMSLNVHQTPWYNRIRSKRMVQTVRF